MNKFGCLIIRDSDGGIAPSYDMGLPLGWVLLVMARTRPPLSKCVLSVFYGLTLPSYAKPS